MNGEDYLYQEIRRQIAYALNEYDIGPMTVHGVIDLIRRELEIERDDFIDECRLEFLMIEGDDDDISGVQGSVD